jgi:hypothetical protein
MTGHPLIFHLTPNARTRPVRATIPVERRRTDPAASPSRTMRFRGERLLCRGSRQRRLRLPPLQLADGRPHGPAANPKLETANRSHISR